MNDPHEIMTAYLEGKLDAEQVAQLEAYLREDRARAEAFVRQAMLDSHLTELMHEQNIHDVATDLSGDSQFGALLQALDAPAGTGGPIDFTEVIARGRHKPAEQDHGSLSGHDLAVVGGYVLRKAITSKPAIYTGITTAAAAVLLLALILINPFASDAPDPIAHIPAPADPVAQPPAVATLTAQHDAQWAQASIAPGSDLKAGERFTLINGFAQITTKRGAVMILEAPATIELIDHNNALRLHHGKLVGLCHTEQSKGLLVRTPQMDVTDLSTEFGVRVDQEGVEATVFVGEVSVETAGGQAQHVTDLQTARLEIKGDQRNLVIEDRLAQDYTRRLPRPALVQAVQISADGLEANIASQSLFADALLYNDRTYRLEFSAEADMPAELLGADIVQMPIDGFVNASKEMGDAVQVSLTVRQPAQVYVLVPPNARPGPWLERDYKPTDMILSIKNHDAIDPLRWQRSLKIWQRREPVTGTTVVAGSLVGPHQRGSGMYTMLVQPVPDSEPDNRIPIQTN